MSKKVWGVVRFPGLYKRLEVIDPRYLEGYARKWNTDSSLWPEQCLLMSDDGDRECMLVYIGCKCFVLLEKEEND